MSQHRTKIEPFTVAGRWHRLVREGHVQCLLCPRKCVLGPDQRGFCFVRDSDGTQVRLTSYGRTSGLCIDPIEKKPLNHFYPGTTVLSFGTAGCNLGCKFCQNWQISKSRDMSRLARTATPDEVAFLAVRRGCKSVAFTYNDPVIFAEYAIDCAQACHALGVTTVAVTAGYITEEARADFFEHIDAANVDLKALSEDFYRRMCLGSLQPVLDTLLWLRQKSNVWLEITNLLIPGENDSVDDVARLCGWVAAELGTEVPLHFSAFHPAFKLLDRPRTPSSTLRRAYAQARSAGIKHVYTGNVSDRAGQSTYCAGCSALIIERDGFSVGGNRLDDKRRCLQCGHVLAGRFEGTGTPCTHAGG